MGFVSVMIDSYERGRDVRHRRPGRRDVGGFTDAARADHETIAPTALGGTRTKDRVGAPVRGLSVRTSVAPARSRCQED